MTLRPYISIARIDNWSKNLLMFVGVVLAAVMGSTHSAIDYTDVAHVLFALCFASSANYALNETLDASQDGNHPIKKTRPSVKHELNRAWVFIEYAVLAGAALFLAYRVSPGVCAVLVFYLACAWAYNIPPVRVKDVPYGDVLLESINYPIRILLGWLSVLPQDAPPTSVLIIGWSIGAFVMSLKRLAEYQLFDNPQQAASYRKSYAHYTVPRLLLSSFVYAMLTVFGITIFMIKYKTELLLMMPLLVAWMSWYLMMGYRRELCIVYPERLLGSRIFLGLVALTVTLLTLLLNTDIAWLHIISQPLEYR